MSSTKGATGTKAAVIVSANQETLDDLDAYLRGVGIAARCGRGLDILDEIAAGVVALVVFPDDFLFQSVVRAMATLSTRHPRILSVLVTADPRRFERALPKLKHVLILPRPTWAWTIYDGIREHLAAIHST
jgi:hypothetical protein